MARMVIFTDATSHSARPIAVNADLVTQVTPVAEYKGAPATLLYLVADDERVMVHGDLQTVVARLNGEAARAIDTVHLTGWVLDPNHPDRRYRLHPSILTDDQPPAWAAQPATNGGEQ